MKKKKCLYMSDRVSCVCVRVQIFAAEPCNSVSTGLQCEMDPLSQTQACELLSALGHSVVGWYHSHPTFHPNPSLRDIHTQDQFQVPPHPYTHTHEHTLTSTPYVCVDVCVFCRVISLVAEPPS